MHVLVISPYEIERKVLENEVQKWEKERYT